MEQIQAVPPPGGAAAVLAAPHTEEQQQLGNHKPALPEQQQQDGDQKSTPHEQHHHHPDNHAAVMQSAFARSEAVAACQWDIWAGVSVSILLLLALPSALQRQHWRAQLAGFSLEVLLRVLPAALSALSPEAYLANRTYVVAACRLASSLLPCLAPPSASSLAAWGGWRQFLLLSGALGVNTLPWLARLPFKWFAGVHLIDVLSVGRATLRDVCGSPAFAAPEAARQFAVAGRVARALSMMAPMPNPQASNTTACIDVLVASAGTDAMAAAGNGACACRQLATWILAVVGFALPLACQYLAEAAARRRFLRRHCRQLHCDGCSIGKGADVVTLGLTAALLLGSFSGASWQLASLVFSAPGSPGVCAAAL